MKTAAEPQRRPDPSPRAESFMIEAHGVCKVYRRGDEQVEALRGVSFRIRAGSCAIMVGPSGSGKSTLLYILGTLDQPTSGTIHIDGQDVSALTVCSIMPIRT
jgi:putative ABC transport system ATP-binding protein